MFLGGNFGDISKSISRIKQDIKKAFSSIKGEMDEHLESINANTSEIHSNYEYVSELESRIDKLNERIEDLEMHQDHNPRQKSQFRVRTLTRREQEVFLALYTLEQDQKPITYSRIGQFLGINEYIIQDHITSLITKGVPIHKNFFEKTVYLRLNPEFRELQAKKNIARVNEMVSKKISSI